MALSNNKILEAMLDRATNPADEVVDELAVQIFCVTIRNDPNLIHKATCLIVSKVQSPNVTQSVRALSLLEECMAKCGSNFQDEVSKFRFLNDLIRLVSKKYQGGKTPAPIREKIMDCLLLWTTEYPNKTKIREAYDLLRKEGNDHTPMVTVTKKDSIMGIDEEKFRKLLQSGNAEDLKRANLLIQSRVNQDARRMELVCRHKSELEEIQNTVVLLSQMLDSFSINRNDEERDTFHLIRELYESCENYLPIMERLPELIDYTNEELIDQTLEINDRLQTVIDRYKSIVLPESSPNLLATERPPEQTVITTQNTSDLLSDVLNQEIKLSASKPGESLSPLDELNEVFGKCDDSILHPNFDSINLLEPTTTAPDQEQFKKDKENLSPKYDNRQLKDIDILSEKLFKENLKTVERLKTFRKEPERVSLNDLAKEQLETSVKSTPASSPKEADSNSEVFNNHNQGIVIKMYDQSPDHSIKSNFEDVGGAVVSEALQPEKSHRDNNSEKSLPLIHLADVCVDLDEICPTHEKLLLDDDIKVTLNFTSNRPSSNVSVIVVSVTNQTKLPLTSFQFDASVRKPSKIRLLPATADSMPAKKPFRPPSPINQVMLLLNPTKADVDVTCIVGYKLGDDPDLIKESIIAKNIAYVE